MTPEARQFIEHAQFTRGAIAQMSAMLPADDGELDAWISDAVRHTDQMAFLLLIMAAFTTDRPVDARHLVGGAKFLEHGAYAVVALMRMRGDVPEYFLKALQHSMMQPAAEAAALYSTAIWCDEHRNGVYPSEMIPTARALARRSKNSTEALAFLVALAVHTNDSGLMSTVRRHFPEASDDQWAHIQDTSADVKKVMERCRGPVLELMPEAAPDMLQAGHTVRRAVPRLGRNAPCWCGSGKKYKNCHHAQDQKRLHDSSEVAGVTYRELYTKVEPHLTRALMEKVGPVDAMRMEPLEVPRHLLTDYFLRLAAFNLFERAIEGLEKLGYSDDLEDAWRIVMIMAVRSQRKDIAERLVQLRGVNLDDIGLGARLLLAESDAAQCLQMIEDAAMQVLKSEDNAELSDLAFAVGFSKYSGLGLLLYRGIMPLLSPEQAASSYEHILAVRDRLNLPPDDPISELVDARLAATGEEDKDAVRELRQQLEGKRRETRALLESREQLKKELARMEKARVAAVSAATPVVADERLVKELRQKIETLETILKTTHTERNAFRRELQKAESDLEKLRQASPPPPNSEAAPADNEEDLLMPQEMETNYPLRLIEFPKNFQQRLGAVPRHVARSAMVLVGKLAAGDPAAFVGALRLKAAPAFMRQRVGIDFRLLFRLHADRIEVADLIPRQDLERRIKTL